MLNYDSRSFLKYDSTKWINFCVFTCFVYFQGRRFIADLLPDGKIQMPGTKETFTSPSAWAIHCKKQVNPHKKSGCGWASVSSWHFFGLNFKTKTLNYKYWILYFTCIRVYYYNELIYVWNREKHITQILKSRFYFWDICKLHETMIKFGFRNFMFLRFDWKQLNHGIVYSRKISNLQ